MKEAHKKEVAVFRFGIIQDFVNGPRLTFGDQEALIRHKCARKWDIPYSNRTSISRSTIQRWIKLYKESGNRLESLYPKQRSDLGESRVLGEELCGRFKAIREQMPDAPVSLLLKTLQNRNELPADFSISTAYRYFKQANLMRPPQIREDRRKFEAEHPNDIWQSDVMHGPHLEYQGKLRKSYLIALMDDHSSLVPHGEFYLSEKTQSFMSAFEAAILKRGLPRKLYVDNGSAYRSKQLAHTSASLGIALCHARAYKPQGKGKIERFFKTVRSQFLPAFKGTTLDDINAAFADFLTNEYSKRKHSATGQSPLQRFVDGIECIRPIPEDLKAYFRKCVRRRVNNDRTIVLDHHLYEGPVSLIGKQVELHFHEGEYDQVELRYKQQSYGMLQEVDLNVNCKVKRDKNNDPMIESDNTPVLGGSMWEV
jgi:transposase InsO family protein